MLQATFIPGRELSRIGPDRIKDEGPQKIKSPTRIADGPQIQAGPFILPASLDLSGHKIYVHKNVWTKSRAAHNIVNWAGDAIWQVSQNLGWNKYPYAYEKNGQLWANSSWKVGAGVAALTVFNKIGKKQHLYPRFDQSDGVSDVNVGGYWMSAPGNKGEVRGVGHIMVPPDQVWGVAFFTGKKPIAKFKHPVTEQEWGIYCLITGNDLQFTFKKVSKSWLGQLWDWIKSLPAKIIEFVSDVIDALKGLGCAAARGYLDTIGQLASGQLMLSASVANPLMAVGLSATQLDQLENGATAAGAQAIAGTVIDSVCGPVPKPVTKQYPAGAVQAFDPGSKQWIIAVPKNKSLSGGLGVNPETGEQYEVYEKASGKAVTVVAISFDELKKWLRPPWYSPRSPWFWGGLAALGTSGYVGWRVLRKRRA